MTCAEIGGRSGQCRQYVHYDRRSGSLKFAGFGLSELSIGTDTKVLQVASDLTQIFDEYQAATCSTLNRLRGKPEYEAAVSSNLDALARLAELMTVVSKSKLSDEDVAKVADSIQKGKDLKTKLPSEQQNKINLDAHLAAANPEFQEVLRKFQPVARTCAWNSIGEQPKADVVRELGSTVRLVASLLRIQSPELVRSYIFMVCADNRLYPAPGLSTLGDTQRASLENIRILPNYGFVGVAYQTGERQIGVIPKSGQTMSFTMGQKKEERRTQEEARRILIEPDAMLQSTAKWVIAVPLKNQNREVVGVMSISSDAEISGNVEQEESDLESAVENGRIQQAADQVASYLVSETTQGRKAEKP